MDNFNDKKNIPPHLLKKVEELTDASQHLLNQLLDEFEKREIPIDLAFTTVFNLLIRMLSTMPIQVTVQLSKDLPDIVLQEIFEKDFT